VKKTLALPAYLSVLLICMFFQGAAQVSYPEIVGCPTDQSILINVIVQPGTEFHYVYGYSSGSYTGQTENITAPDSDPVEVVIDGLDPDTRYYYRLRYRSGENWIDRPERIFHTKRAKGNEYCFTVTADSHAQYNATYRQAMINILGDLPDFNIDLGDTFMPDGTNSQSAVDADYLAQRSPDYLGHIGHSVPIFLTAGNHENEEGWNIDDTPFSIAVGNIQSRKKYFPTPVSDGFYSGNTDPLAEIDEGTYGDELREDYYAWEWGDALFVVLDEYLYTMDLPYSPGMAGEGTDDSQTGDQWSWTLGEQQFNWFKQTIQNSNAKYKFVFSHHVTGGVPDPSVSGGAGYVRGGAGAAPYFEWGGNNADGTWGFDTHRPGWGGVPIHQLMVENGVSAYFHGHDHQYVYEELDGVVYQEVPSPSMSGSGFGGIYSESDPFTNEMLPNAGHLRITVAPDVATVEYVRSNITEVSYTYTIEPNEVVETGILGDVNEDEAVNSTDALIVLSCDAGIDVSQFCPMDCGDVNEDGAINSTDALIILSYDAGMTVPYPAGESGCPSGVTPCAGCTP
jgi:hypothetical protein